MRGQSPGKDVYARFSEFYDLYVGDFRDDLSLYRRYAARARTPLVEIGAGSGRLTLPLARAGHTIVAVDVSRSMLRLLAARLGRERAAVRRRVRIVNADAARLRLPLRSDLILVPFYTFNYLMSARQRREALARIAEHLTDRGRALVDVFVPRGRLGRCPRGPVLRVDRRDPVTGARVRGWNRYTLDRRRQVEVRRQRMLVEERDGRTYTRRFTIRRRYWFPHQLRRMFEDAGFTVQDVFAGYDGRPPGRTAEQLVYVLQRARGGA